MTVEANSIRSPSNKRVQEGAAAASRVLRRLLTSTDKLSVIALGLVDESWKQREQYFRGLVDRVLKCEVKLRHSSRCVE